MLFEWHILRVLIRSTDCISSSLSFRYVDVPILVMCISQH